MVRPGSVVAIIPARGGSKGIPRKNVLPFGEHPLIAFVITAALEAETIDRTIVTTDNDEIAEVANQWGAEVPFMRPSGIAEDDTPDLPVFQHAVRWLLEHEGYEPEVVAQLRPTSPTLPMGFIDRGVRRLREHPDADSLRAVIPSQECPYKTWHIDRETRRLRPLLELPGVAEPYNAPRQSLPPTYWQTGHLDVIRTRTIMEKDSMSGSVMLPLELEPEFAVDLDTRKDWLRAERAWNLLAGRVVDPGRGERAGAQP